MYKRQDYNQEEQCDVLSSCFWDDGVRLGQWYESQDSLYVDINNFSSFYGFQNNEELSLYGSLGDDNECFKFEFDYESSDNDTLIYNIDSISRFGNNECIGSPISGICETTDSFGIFTEDLCLSSGGSWSPYLNEYDINNFKFFINIFRFVFIFLVLVIFYTVFGVFSTVSGVCCTV